MKLIFSPRLTCLVRLTSWSCAIVLALVLFGCSAASTVVRVQITELNDGNPDHPDYAYWHRRLVAVVGKEAREIADKLPAPVGKPPGQFYPGGEVRFDLSLIYSNGAERRVQVVSKHTLWVEEGNWYQMCPGTVELLERLLKNSRENPLVEAEIIQYEDDDRHRYQAPKRYVTTQDPDAIRRLFPDSGSPAPKGSQSLDGTTLVVLHYADGKRTDIEVSKDKWKYTGEDGDPRTWLLSELARIELRRRLAMIGNTAEPTTASTISPIEERMRKRRETEPRPATSQQAATSPAP